MSQEHYTMALPELKLCCSSPGFRVPRTRALSSSEPALPTFEESALGTRLESGLVPTLTEQRKG